jgi:hypothetical protein
MNLPIWSSFLAFRVAALSVEFQLTVVGAAYKVEVYFYLAGYRSKKYFLLHEESFR